MVPMGSSQLNLPVPVAIPKDLLLVVIDLNTAFITYLYTQSSINVFHFTFPLIIEHPCVDFSGQFYLRKWPTYLPTHLMQVFPILILFSIWRLCFLMTWSFRDYMRMWRLTCQKLLYRMPQWKFRHCPIWMFGLCSGTYYSESLGYFHLSEKSQNTYWFLKNCWETLNGSSSPLEFTTLSSSTH